MADIEKVIKGLEHCSSNPRKRKHPCIGCPYQDSEYYCAKRVRLEALKFLKEQQQTIEDLKATIRLMEHEVI